MAERFVEKRQFAIPLDTFIELWLSEKDAVKYALWMKRGDSVEIVPFHSGKAVVILNRSLLNKGNEKHG